MRGSVRVTEFDLVITGGTVADSGGSSLADLGITAGRISGIATSGSLKSSDRHINAHGMIVVPGGVDPHVHSATPVGEFETLDSFAMSTTAAAWGGTTTIIDFAIPGPAGGDTALVNAEQRILAAHDAVVDVGFHASIAIGEQISSASLQALVDRGLTTLKVSYRDLAALSIDDLRGCMRAMAAVDGLVLVHAEDPGLIEPLRDGFIRGGQTSADKHAASHPPAAELEMVRRVIDLLRDTHCLGYFVHVSTPESVEAIAEARLSGVRVWSETCPQYVFLDDHVYELEDAPLYICSPPIRSPSTARRLWSLVSSGFVDIWGSDHCCYDRAQKLRHRSHFNQVPVGLPGVEVRAPLLFSEGVSKGRLSIEKFVALTATNPARLNGLFPRKGSFVMGADADVAIYDPSLRVPVGAGTLHMPTDFMPFEGYISAGWPRTILSRGRVVVDDMAFVGEVGWGQFLPAKRPEAPL